MDKQTKYDVSPDEYDLAVEQDILESEGLFSIKRENRRVLKPEEWVSFVDRDVLTAIDLRFNSFQLRK